MSLEIEQKFRLADHEQIKKKLETLGAVFAEPIEQVDLYFNHPSRDFAQTHEALRIRRHGEENRVTFKGPKLNQVPKVRKEIEILFNQEDSTFEQMKDLFRELGFVEVRTVKKLRQAGKFHWQGYQVEAALDDVEGLGNYLELEIVCESDQSVDVQKALTELIDELQLVDTEQHSYLSLLLAADRQ